MQDIFGGSSGSSGSQNTSQSGFALLPPEIQQAFTNLASTATNTLNPSATAGGAGTPNASIDTLPALGAPSSSALSSIANQNYAITPQSISADMNEQMDPYQSSVIGQIENAQNGSLSQLNSYLTNSGDFGSNRGMLGASDISNVAANQVGSFLSGEYNTNMNNALTTIPQNQAQSAAGSVQAGQLTQQQQMQNQQAPLTALQQLSQLMGVLPTSGGSTAQGTSSSQQSSSPGIFNDLFG